ncbi:hypothetical protein D9M68_839720 [compost metagenome]
MLAIGFNLQDARGLVGIERPRPIPGGETHRVPLPAVARHTWRGLQDGGQCRCLTAKHLLDRHTSLDSLSTARMIAVGMADHHQVEPAHIQGAQRWQHHPFAHIEIAETWTRVV